MTEWNIETTRFMNSASNRNRCQTTEVSMERDHIEVNAEVGSGYCREQTSAYIPMEVIVRMMEHAGYVVTRVVCPHCNNSNNQHGIGCPNGE